jgi:dihydroorotate dehydrogenase
MLWRTLIRPILFRLPTESVHHWSMSVFHGAMFPPMSTMVRAITRQPDPSLRCRVWGLDFDNPVGLAAGFDKQARWFDSLGNLGFSHVEAGTITGRPQPGNPPPRLFRLPADQALVNRMGFNNPGADVVARQLRRRSIRSLPGINIGKSKVVELVDSTDDYLQSFRALYPFARYFAINVSSPNTPGLRSLQAREPLLQLLNALRDANAELATRHNTTPRPVLLKVAPDLNHHQLAELASIVEETSLDGLIATNTTVSREGLVTPAAQVSAIGDGGLSGRPLTLRSREIVRFLYRETRGRVPIIGVGGIMNGEDAWQMIRQGASLIQVYTGFIYGGPMFVRQINRHLAKCLRQSGMDHVSEAVGSGIDD